MAEPPPAPRIAEVSMRWLTELQFEGGGPGQPSILVDGDTKVATSPVQLLLLAAATCTASDIVIILKQRISSKRWTSACGDPPRSAAAPYYAIVFHVSVRGEAKEGKCGARSTCRWRSTARWSRHSPPTFPSVTT
jgi:uncharacterized OsmC-like protein